ncbi:MAG: hypothetical protein ACYTAN_07285 [Planctomycetota bacterium]
MGKRDHDRLSRMAVLVSLFLVRGPFALRKLWKSDRFARGEKVVLTVVVAVYTIAIVTVFYIAATRIHASLLP